MDAKRARAIAFLRHGISGRIVSHYCLDVPQKRLMQPMQNVPNFLLTRATMEALRRKGG